MPIRLAITGPSGAGKSSLCRRLVALGALVVDADRVGHAMLDVPQVQARLVASFGADVVGPGGVVDRGILARHVFADPARRELLDRLTHPALAAEIERRLVAAAETEAPLVVLEAAVYFLLPGPPAVDHVIALLADPVVRRRRLLATGLTSEQADARIAAQTHLEPTWARADRIIRNDGDEAALAAVARDLFREYSPGGTS
jgi:dephospho-CoA kinase